MTGLRVVEAALIDAEDLISGLQATVAAGADKPKIQTELTKIRLKVSNARADTLEIYHEVQAAIDRL